MHVKSVQLIEATQTMLEEVNEIYLKCRESLFGNGILQWNDQYPNREYFMECIENKVLFVLMDDSKILGHVVLNEWESEEWDMIPWEGSKPIVIHSLMINPLLQGKGMGTDFVKLCENFAKELGYKSVRLDAFSRNEIAIHLYDKLGYQKRGSVIFPFKP
ncbi:MAG TPA: GNAT family N-acetyltransferase, partial [Pseudoneobacillus sp.]|nr:GNAT family N-acetyltransferase [Pseudoneobacillus sp.]